MYPFSIKKRKKTYQVTSHLRKEEILKIRAPSMLPLIFLSLKFLSCHLKRQEDREKRKKKKNKSPKALIKCYMWQSRQTASEEKRHLWQSDIESFQKYLLRSCWRNLDVCSNRSHRLEGFFLCVSPFPFL